MRAVASPGPAPYDKLSLVEFGKAMNQPIRGSVVLLALAGLGSAVLTVRATFGRNFEMFSVGFIFGIALAMYFAVYEGHRNPFNLAGFVCACTAAYPAAFFSAFGLFTVFPVNASMGSARLDIPMPVFFGAGCVGAFIVIAAGIFLFGPGNISGKSFGMIVLWSLGGGVLGVVGGGADGIRTHGTYNQMFLLFLIWQPGAAVLLGLLLTQVRAAQPAPSMPVISAEKARTVKVNRGMQTLSRAFFVCVLVFLGFLVYRTVRSERIDAQMDAARKRAVAEAPPINDLPQIEPVPLGQALIVREIAGLYPWLPMSNSSGQLSRTLPPAVNYLVGYTTTNAPPPNAVRRILAVTVTQLPNAEWALYRVKYPLMNVAVESPKSLTKVTKFGQTIVQDTHMRYPDGGGTLCFLWPSGNFAISVCYETPDVNEEFIRQYLEKYPSSL